MRREYLKVGGAVAISSFVTPRLINAMYSPISMGEDTDSTTTADNMQLILSIVGNAAISAGIYYGLTLAGV